MTSRRAAEEYFKQTGAPPPVTRFRIEARQESPPHDDWQAPTGIPDGPVGAQLMEPTEQPNSARILHSAKFIEGFVPPDYLLDGILQRRFIYSLTGRSGSGKSALVLLFSASVALGRAIGKHPTESGRVLYLAGENPDDIRMRWIAMSQVLGFDVGEIPVHFIAGTFKISTMFDRIRAEVEAIGPFALVIVDTSAAFFEGNDENSNTQAGAHARELRRLVSLPGGPCVLVAAHPTKNAGADNLLPRGGGAFLAEVDGNLTAAKENGVVELHWQGKFRGPEFAPISFQLDTVTHERLKDSKGRFIPTVTASFLSETAQDAIAAAARSNENLVLNAYAEKPDASLAEIGRSLGWLLRSGDPDKMKVKRAVGKLKDAKLMSEERGKPVLTDKGRKLIATAQTKTSEE